MHTLYKMNFSYEKKYLKYKKKYLDLKNLLKGGDAPIVPVVPAESTNPTNQFTQSFGNQQGKNILIVSHNARMRCFIDTLKGVKDIGTNPPTDVENIMKYKLGTSGEKEIRFMNGAVLKVTLNPNSDEGTIELFYEGIVNNRNKGLYFTQIESIPENNVAFGKYTFNYVETFNVPQIPFNINFYIVRHGEGTHNLLKKGIATTVSKGVNSILGYNYDPKLTTDGENQATGAGKKFQEVGIKFDFIFVSKLQRTMQTAYLILKNSGNLIQDKTTFIVIPCLHELNYAKSGNCDQANAAVLQSFRPPENISNCESKDKTFDQCTEQCCKFIMTYYADKPDGSVDYEIKVEWDDYNDFFYKNGSNCKDTNFIAEALKYVARHSG